MFIRWYCFSCGMEKMAELKDANEHELCPSCENLMFPDYDDIEADEELARSMDTDEPELTPNLENTMRDLINCIGDKDVWETLEKETNAKHRYMQRRIFQKVGGKVPDGEPILIK